MRRARKQDVVRMPRRARRARTRRLRRAFLTLLTIVSLAAGGVALVRSPLFEVDGIEVAGLELLDRESVLEASGLRLGMNVLSVDAGRVRERLRKLPLVRRARVERIYPSRVRIRLVERSPAAVARLPGSSWLIEETGTLIAGVATPPPGLPQLQVHSEPGSDALREALRLWGSLPAWARSKTSELTATQPALITAKIGGTLVVFGSSDEVVPKIQAVVAVFERAKTDGRRVVRIDVRAPRRPAAVFV